MSYENNSWMSRFEIKEPDFDYMDRGPSAMDTAEYESARYTKDGENWKQKSPAGKSSVTLMFTGDITCFDKQIEEAQTETGYDFNYAFEAMKPVFAQADLVVGNIETALCPYAPYRSEKIVIEENFYCNAPLEFLDAVRQSGVDVLTNANNHDIDAGAIGLGESIDNIRRFGFIHTGTFKDERKRYEIIDVEGYKVAITAFATDHNALTINLTEEGINYMLNDYTKERAKEIIDAARAEGAEVVFACMHWGKENWTTVHKNQKTIGKQLADMGYDCIIGSHPHVLQPYTTITSGDRTVPVFYSLGNYVSQNFNNVKSRSVIAVIDLSRADGKVKIDCSYIPISTVESYNGRPFVVIPLKKISKRPKNIRKLQRISGEIGEEIAINDSYVNKDYKEDKVVHEKKEKAVEPDISKITSFPFEYEDNHFTYTVYEDHVRINSIKPEYRSVSCTVPEEVLGLPLTESVDGIFENNDHLRKIKSIGIPYVSARLCKNCQYLEGFRMGQGTTVVREEAFAGCTNLYSAVMKRGVKTIESKAFKGCTNLKSVKVPNNVTDIADDAFEGCSRAVFYCDEGSYAEQYAKEHGFKVIYMKLP